MAEQPKFAPKGRIHRKSIRSKAPPLADKAPNSLRITTYDEAHFVVYLRLLDAKSKDASDEAMLAIILEAAPLMGREKARRALQSHLKRAVWMSDEGYRGLLGKKPRRST